MTVYNELREILFLASSLQLFWLVGDDVLLVHAVGELKLLAGMKVCAVLMSPDIIGLLMRGFLSDVVSRVVLRFPVGD